MLIDDKETYVPGKQAEEPLRKLKPSEAIRIGIALRPKQCFGSFYQDGASCVLGAMWEGYGRNPDEIGCFLGMRFIEYIDAELAMHISDKNDGVGVRSCWTREAIADWLEAQGR
jgi:hypothetical protein